MVLPTADVVVVSASSARHRDGISAFYELNSTTGTLAAGELAVAPKPDEFCFVTLTTSPGTFSKDVLTQVAQTAQFT